jgi:hypothetical protein
MWFYLQQLRQAKSWPPSSSFKKKLDEKILLPLSIHFSLLLCFPPPFTPFFLSYFITYFLLYFLSFRSITVNENRQETYNINVRAESRTRYQVNLGIMFACPWAEEPRYYDEHKSDKKKTQAQLSPTHLLLSILYNILLTCPWPSSFLFCFTWFFTSVQSLVITR